MKNEYLSDVVGIPLRQCLAELILQSPRDPIEWIASWLYRYVDQELYYNEKYMFVKNLYHMERHLAADREAQERRLQDLRYQLQEAKKTLKDEEMLKCLLKKPAKASVLKKREKCAGDSLVSQCSLHGMEHLTDFHYSIQGHPIDELNLDPSLQSEKISGSLSKLLSSQTISVKDATRLGSLVQDKKLSARETGLLLELVEKGKMTGDDASRLIDALEGKQLDQDDTVKLIHLYNAGRVVDDDFSYMFDVLDAAEKLSAKHAKSNTVPRITAYDLLELFEHDTVDYESDEEDMPVKVEETIPEVSEPEDKAKETRVSEPEDKTKETRVSEPEPERETETEPEPETETETETEHEQNPETETETETETDRESRSKSMEKDEPEAKPKRKRHSDKHSGKSKRKSMSAAKAKTARFSGESGAAATATRKSEPGVAAKSPRRGTVRHVYVKKRIGTWSLDCNLGLICDHPVLGKMGARTLIPPESPVTWVNQGYSEHSLYDHEIYSCPFPSKTSSSSIIDDIDTIGVNNPLRTEET